MGAVVSRTPVVPLESLQAEWDPRLSRAADPATDKGEAAIMALCSTGGSLNDRLEFVLSLFQPRGTARHALPLSSFVECLASIAVGLRVQNGVTPDGAVADIREATVIVLTAGAAAGWYDPAAASISFVELVRHLARPDVCMKLIKALTKALPQFDESAPSAVPPTAATVPDPPAGACSESGSSCAASTPSPLSSSCEASPLSSPPSSPPRMVKAANAAVRGRACAASCAPALRHTPLKPRMKFRAAKVASALRHMEVPPAQPATRRPPAACAPACGLPPVALPLDAARGAVGGATSATSCSSAPVSPEWSMRRRPHTPNSGTRSVACPAGDEFDVITSQVRKARVARPKCTAPSALSDRRLEAVARSGRRNSLP